MSLSHDASKTNQAQVVRLSIVVVEDHDDLRDAMAEALSRHGHVVHAVASAEQFAELAAQTLIDIVIIDLNLPGEDGISLTKRLRQAYPTIGLIIVSARGLVQEKTRGYENGADIYLTKPVALQELVAAVASLGNRVKQPVSVDHNCLRFDCLEVTGPTGQTTKLPVHEAVLLRTLVLAQNYQVKYGDLMQAIGKNPQAYSKSALELVVVRLRKRMQSVGFEPSAITAVRNQGYRLTVSIELV